MVNPLQLLLIVQNQVWNSVLATFEPEARFCTHELDLQCIATCPIPTVPFLPTVSILATLGQTWTTSVEESLTEEVCICTILHPWKLQRN